MGVSQNGRLEIIATNTGGSGMYSYSNYYEVNETFDGIKQCDYPYIEYDSQPDISFGNLGAYFDPNTGHYYYIFFDYMRGTGIDYYDSTSSISLQNGNIISRVLGSCSTTYNENGNIESEVCKDEYGKKIDSETYQTLSEKVYQEYTKYKVTFGWKDYTMDNNIVDIPMAELVDVLTESYQGFSLEAE